MQYYCILLFINLLISGITLDMARVALGKSEPQFGFSFVALSRVRRFQDLLIDFQNFSLMRLVSIKLPAIAVAFDKLTEKLSLNTMRIYEI
jgi:hypothetical protein